MDETNTPKAPFIALTLLEKRKIKGEPCFFQVNCNGKRHMIGRMADGRIKILHHTKSEEKATRTFKLFGGEVPKCFIVREALFVGMHPGTRRFYLPDGVDYQKFLSGPEIKSFVKRVYETKLNRKRASHPWKEEKLHIETRREKLHTHKRRMLAKELYQYPEFKISEWLRRCGDFRIKPEIFDGYLIQRHRINISDHEFIADILFHDPDDSYGLLSVLAYVNTQTKKLIFER